ncbi:MAG TPA: hypothetical protein V6C57_26385 [Coleofasciculaceae cyanobacterium]
MRTKPTPMDDAGFQAFCRELCPKLDFIGKAFWVTTWAITYPDQKYSNQNLQTPEGMSLFCEFEEKKQRITVTGYGYKTSCDVKRPILDIASQIHRNVIQPGHPKWQQEIANKKRQKRITQEKQDTAKRLAAIVGIRVLDPDRESPKPYGSFPVRTSMNSTGIASCHIEIDTSYQNGEVRMDINTLPTDLAAILLQTIATYQTAKPKP